MTEYWQSQARKFCDFCKCWLADNKVSVSFHENGKRHKENVKKHISKLSKKSVKEFKQKEKIDDELKKMEEAAMKAYLKDIQNNADLTSQEINNKLLNEKSSSSSITPTTSAVKEKPPPMWHEIQCEEGSYFWNVENNETTWDPPDQYLSLAQQEEQKLKEKEKLKEKQKAQELMEKEKQKEVAMEVKAHILREKMKERAIKKDPEPEKPSFMFGPPQRAAPYGAWKPVSNKLHEDVNLQLPKANVPPPPVAVQPEIIKFKEKTAGSLGEGPVDFKKRKINSNFKRNIRQKTNDD